MAAAAEAAAAAALSAGRAIGGDGTRRRVVRVQRKTVVEETKQPFLCVSRVLGCRAAGLCVLVGFLCLRGVWDASLCAGWC